MTILAPAIRALMGREAKLDQATRFRRYLALLTRWNATQHLTALRTPRDITTGLFLDSLLFLVLVPLGAVKVADIGTGLGIPGIPLRIARDNLSLTVVESRRKCVSFLSALKREIDLADLVILEGRAEDLVERSSGLAETFDVVITRAVGAAVLPAAMRYLRPGGLYVAGGPPSGAGAIPDPLAKLLTAKTVRFDRLDLERTFLIAQKPA